jgi:Cap4, dsDNA endonuclease domain
VRVGLRTAELGGMVGIPGEAQTWQPAKKLACHSRPYARRPPGDPGFDRSRQHAAELHQVTALSGGRRLGQVEPRERVGAQTGRKYEYQYERTARAALDLLGDTARLICVYCDWHDDYVVETYDTPTRYRFHQVKGRKSSQGPWRFSEFFGVVRKTTKQHAKKPPVLKLDAIVPRMVLHHKNFNDSCAGVAFVTNTGLDPELSDFLEIISRSTDAGALPEDARIAFEHLARAYLTTDPPLAPSAAALFAWLRELTVRTDQGNLENGDAALLELAGVVVDYSEIDLRLLQAKQIAREIVNRVRTKVSHSTTVVPAADVQLRQDKGIVVEELLTELSLSTDAYEELKAGASPETIKTLSRLHRFCLKNKLGDSIVSVCGFKAQWDIWRTIERHFLKSADYVLLENKAIEVLRAGLTLEQMVAEAKAIARQFEGIPATPLASEHVLGLIFSLAAQSEAPKSAQDLSRVNER